MGGLRVLTVVVPVGIVAVKVEVVGETEDGVVEGITEAPVVAGDIVSLVVVIPVLAAGETSARVVVGVLLPQEVNNREAASNTARRK
jgi:hypothetical protein